MNTTSVLPESLSNTPEKGDANNEKNGRQPANPPPLRIPARTRKQQLFERKLRPHGSPAVCTYLRRERKEKSEMAEEQTQGAAPPAGAGGGADGGGEGGLMSRVLATAVAASKAQTVARVRYCTPTRACCSVHLPRADFANFQVSMERWGVAEAG